MSALHVILGLIVAIQVLLFGASALVVMGPMRGSPVMNDGGHWFGQLVVVHGAGLVLTLLAAWRVKVWVCRPGQVFLDQVRALGEWHFEQHPQPSVQEWVPISKALNVVVERVRNHLHERDLAVGDLRNQINHDDLTLATSRQHFMWLLESQLQTRHAVGGVSILRVHDLEGLNQRLGRHRTDELLVAVATTIRAHLLLHHTAEDFVLARLNGADFGLLLTGATTEALQTRLEGIAAALVQLSQEGLSDVSPTAWVGGAAFEHGETVSQVLARVDSMVMQSQDGLGKVAVLPAGRRMAITAVAQWRHVIETALTTGHLALPLQNVFDAQGQVTHQHGSLQLILPDGTRLARAAFMPAAIRCGRSAELELKAVEIALASLMPTSAVISLEMSPQSALRPMFIRRLGELLGHSPACAARVVLELADMRDTRTLLRALEALGHVARETGCALGLREFGVGQTALPLLASYRLRHVQLSARLDADQTSAAHQQAFARMLETWGREAAVRMVPASVLEAGTTESEGLLMA
jgi:predicted signal transduction protein with EAL and GGDEF domain